MLISINIFFKNNISKVDFDHRKHFYEKIMYMKTDKCESYTDSLNVTHDRGLLFEWFMEQGRLWVYVEKIMVNPKLEKIKTVVIAESSSWESVL